MCLGEQVCEWTHACACTCVGAPEPPIPLPYSHQLGAVQLPLRPVPAPGHQDEDHSSPHSQLRDAPQPPAWGQASFLTESKAPFSAGPGGKSARGKWAWGGGLGGGGQLSRAICHLCLPHSPPPSPLRLRVHHSGDPWELEANFPRSLVMERPQVLPLIKVKRGAEEKRCTQASSSHL